MGGWRISDVFQVHHVCCTCKQGLVRQNVHHNVDVGVDVGVD